MRPVFVAGLLGGLAGCSEYTWGSLAPDVFVPPERPAEEPRGGLTANPGARPPAEPWGEPGPEPDAPSESPTGAPDDPSESASSTAEGAAETAGYAADESDEPAAEDGDEPFGDEPSGDEPAGGDPPDDDATEPPGDVVPGRIQGHIDIDSDVGVNAHVYCDAAWSGNALRIRFGDDRFVLESLDWVVCSDEPDRDPEPVTAGFDTLVGEGTGVIGSVAAEVWFLVADGGEPSEMDVLEFEIRIDGELWADAGTGTRGNLQALPPSGAP